MGGDEDRDPNSLNPHLQVLWDDVVGEPEGLHSPDFSWDFSMKVYDASRNCCYMCLAVICGPIVALCSGLNFACLSFCQIWFCWPCLRFYKINLAMVKQFWESCLKTCCAPCYQTMGLIFSKAKVRYQRVDDAPDTKIYDYFDV